VLDNRRRLEELHRERVLARMTPLACEPAYILATEAAYVACAVTEIASLRADLGERLVG